MAPLKSIGHRLGSKYFLRINFGKTMVVDRAESLSIQTFDNV